LRWASFRGNIPEAFATISLFKSLGLDRRYRALLSVAFILPVLAGTVAGYWLINGQPIIVKYLILAFTAGVLTTLVVEEIIPLAHKDGGSETGCAPVRLRVCAAHFYLDIC
jgi:ZIP family zinc transporter